MRFLADMGISQGVTNWLREQGHQVVHLRDEGLQRLGDRDVFLKAASERRVLLTCDLDFGEIVALSGGSTVSVVLLRLRNMRTTFVVSRLGRVIPATASALEQGAIVVVEDARYRIRRLPPGT